MISYSEQEIKIKKLHGHLIQLSMDTNQHRQSKTPSIHQVLTRRLIYATLAITLLVAIVVSLMERQRIVDTVVACIGTDCKIEFA